MKLAPLVPKPKPRVAGSQALQRKPKATASAALREPTADDAESFGDESSEGEVGMVSTLAEHRRLQRAADGFERLPTRELFERGIMGKLVVGDVDDPLEHEADAIADRVMQMPLPGRQVNAAIEPSHDVDSALRRACCSTCACEDEDDEELRREPAAGQRGGSAGEAFTTRVHARIGRGGWPLSVYARNFLEPRLGVDLDRVRTHADADAGSLA